MCQGTTARHGRIYMQSIPTLATCPHRMHGPGVAHLTSGRRFDLEAGAFDLSGGMRAGLSGPRHAVRHVDKE